MRTTGDVAAYEAAAAAATPAGPTGTITIGTTGSNYTCGRPVPIRLAAAPGSGATTACVRVESYGFGCAVVDGICGLELQNGAVTVGFDPCWQVGRQGLAVCRG